MFPRGPPTRLLLRIGRGCGGGGIGAAHNWPPPRHGFGGRLGSYCRFSGSAGAGGRPEFHVNAGRSLKELGVGDPNPLPRVCEGDPVHAAVLQMAELQSSTCLVLERDGSSRVSGIISGRDLIRYYATNGRSPLALNTRELAVGNPVHVTQFASLDQVLGLMRSHRIRTVLMAPSELGGIGSAEEDLSRRQLHDRQVVGAITCSQLLDPLVGLFEEGPAELREAWNRCTVAQLLEARRSPQRSSETCMTDQAFGRREANERLAFLGFTDASIGVPERLRVSSVAAHEPVEKAIKLLGTEGNQGAVLVCQEADRDGNSGGLVGIFTESDFLFRVLPAMARGQGVDPSTTPISEIMTPNPVAISPETTLSQVGDIIRGGHRKHLPVVSFIGDSLDSDSRLTAMVSYRDVLEAARTLTRRYYEGTNGGGSNDKAGADADADAHATPKDTGSGSAA